MKSVFSLYNEVESKLNPDSEARIKAKYSGRVFYRERLTSEGKHFEEFTQWEIYKVVKHQFQTLSNGWGVISEFWRLSRLMFYSYNEAVKLAEFERNSITNNFSYDNRQLRIGQIDNRRLNISSRQNSEPFLEKKQRLEYIESRDADFV